MTLGENIKYYRKLKNMTQNKLAKKTGISKTTLISYEKDYVKRPTYYVLKNISKALDIEVSKLEENKNVNTREDKKNNY